MDKFEYKVRADEIKRYISEKNYKEAASIADTIDWRNVRGTMMLCTVSDLYKACKRFEDSRDILMLAYEKNPGGRTILYSLCELSIKLGDVVNAVEYFKEFSQVAPQDTGRYVLKYKLFTAQGVGIEERIAVLEELEKRECKEKWMYELAYLYHMAGFGEQCVEECNQIVIYFGEGKYVIKALELKAMHEPLSGEQDLLYRRLIGPKESDIVVKDMDVSQYNTIDLQKELADSLKEVLFDDTNKSETPSEDVSVDNKQEEVLYEEVILEDATAQTSEDSYLKTDTFVNESEDSYLVPDEPTIVLNPITDTGKPDDIEATKVIDTASVNAAINNEVAYKQDSESIHDVRDLTKSENEEAVVNGGIDFDSTVSEPETEQLTLDTGFKGTVVEPEPQYVWNRDIREMDLSGSNSPAIKYPNYDDMVSMEGDGQMSIVMPEQEMVDKQITGQISIEDVLLEWERMKNESEKKWQEDMRKRVLQQTTDIFKNFDATKRTGLLEELEDSVNNEEVVVLTADEKESLLSEENADRLNISIEDTIEEEIILEEELEDGANEAELETNALESEEVTDDDSIETDTPSEDEIHEAIDSSVEDEDPDPSELIFDRTPFLKDEDSNDDINAKEPEDPDNTQALPDLSNLDYLMRFAAASEERDIAEKALFGAAQLMANGDSKEQSKESSDMKEIVFDEDSLEENNLEETEEVTEEIKESEDSIEEVDDVTTNEEVTNEVTVEETSEDEPSEEDLHKELETSESTDKESDEVTEDVVEESVEDKITVQESIEDLPDEEAIEDTTLELQANEDEAILQTEDTTEKVLDEDPVEEVNEQEEVVEAKESGKETEEETEKETDNTEAVAEEAVKEPDEVNDSDDGFTDVQRERYENFIQTETGKEQILYALQNVSVNATYGNLIIGSDDTDSAVELGKAIITELAERGEITGKVAKIKASTLNAKDAESTLSVLYDGAIIIQDANELRPETIAGLKKVISVPDKNMFVVLTAHHRSKHKFMMNNSELLEVFNVSIDIESLDNAELAAFAKKYAYAHEYSIDEMGLLALHTKIDERQTNSHSVTVSEVRELIDAAIEHASKKNVGHFFDVLVGKRYDDNDMVVLKEKDFE